MSVEQQRDLAEETLTRVETERLAALLERDEARQVARELLDRVEMLQPPVLAGLRLPSARDAWERKHQWLKEEAER